VLKEILTRGDIILFIDERQPACVPARAEGAIDAASILTDARRFELADGWCQPLSGVPQVPREGAALGAASRRSW